MLIGQTIGSPAKGEFYIEKELGSGAMGTVYRAMLTMKGKRFPVALKIVSLGLVGNESAMARFEREATILQQLRHPHIVRLYGTGKYRGTPYIAMEYIDGEALDRALIRRGRMGWEEVFGYGKQLCEALQHAHEKGIIHRDLKPSNLMITKDGKMKLADFGIAKDTDVTALTGANSTIGTAAYMSPEQCRGSKELSAKSDLYSLGVVFYELITGKKPFYAETTMDMFLKHVNETPVRPSKFVHDLPIWVDNLIMHLMEKSTDTRPLDAATVGRMIQEIETKVQTLQSAGLEVATARKIDRKLNAEAKASSDDLDAARALKGKSNRKKKKKAVPLLQQTWVKGVALGVPLLALVALAVWLAWPVGPEKAFEQVTAATGEEKKTKVLEYLTKFGSSDHPKVAEARAIFKELHTKKIEATLYNRIGTKESKFNRRKANEGEDQAVMDRIWLAMEAEEEGNIKRAADSWAFVAKEVPEAEVNKYTDEDAMRVPPYRWVAERHIGEIKAVGTELQRLNTAYETALVDEKFPNQNPDALALKAMRYEKLGDTANAKLTWDDLRKIVSSDTDKLRWVLLASDRKLANTNDKLSPEEAATSRKKTLDTLIRHLSTDWAELKGNTQKPLEMRKFRNDCRQMTELYTGDPDPMITGYVSQAATMLKEAEGK
jgi:eukaryotic-like serine/threonine-protein kinase